MKPTGSTASFGWRGESTVRPCDMKTSSELAVVRCGREIPLPRRH